MKYVFVIILFINHDKNQTNNQKQRTEMFPFLPQQKFLRCRSHQPKTLGKTLPRRDKPHGRGTKSDLAIFRSGTCRTTLIQLAMKDESIIVLRAKELREIVKEAIKEASNKEPDPEPEKSERLTRREAADFLSVSYQHMYNLTKEGTVKEHGRGRKKFYLKSELKEVFFNLNNNKK